MSLKHILSFDVNRILLFDVNRILSWRIPPMLLKGMAGWFLASFVLQAIGMWRGGLALVLAAASAGVVVVLPDLVRRLRRNTQRT